MINKQKVIIVASNIDDSIKSNAPYLDIYIFKTFNNFNEYIETTPIDVQDIIISGTDLPFTNTSVDKMLNLINSPFVFLSGKIYYIVDDEAVKNKFDEFVEKANVTQIECILRKHIYTKDIVEVLTGDALSVKETVTKISTYRVRAEDYVRTQKDKEGFDYDDSYETDEDLLAPVEDEPIPEDLRPSTRHKALRQYICSDSLRERVTWALLKAQYLALSGKVLFIEKDNEYHTLMDMVTKLKEDIEFDYFDIRDLYKDCATFIRNIRNAKHNLIIVGSTTKLDYDYDVIYNLLVANLQEYLDYVIYETNLDAIPYGMKVDVVFPTTVPEILKGANNMSKIKDWDDIIFIGMDITKFGAVNLGNTEFKGLLEDVFQINNIQAKTVSIRGLKLIREVGIGGISMHM